MPESQAHLTRSETPNPLSEVLDQYRRTLLIGAADNQRFLGRIVIEVFAGASASPDSVEIASTWVLPAERDAGLIFQRVAARLNEMGSQISGSRPAGAVTRSD